MVLTISGNLLLEEAHLFQSWPDSSRLSNHDGQFSVNRMVSHVAWPSIDGKHVRVLVVVSTCHFRRLELERGASEKWQATRPSGVEEARRQDGEKQESR